MTAVNMTDSDARQLIGNVERGARTSLLAELLPKLPLIEGDSPTAQAFSIDFAPENCAVADAWAVLAVVLYDRLPDVNRILGVRIEPSRVEVHFETIA